MLQYLNLGGKKRPILFGSWVFRKMKDEINITPGQVIESLNNSDITILSDVLFYGLQAGEIATNMQNPDIYTVDNVAIWMDMAPYPLSVYSNMIAQAITDKERVNVGGEEGEKKEPAAIGTSAE